MTSVYNKRNFFWSLLALLLLAMPIWAQTTAFTYQGKLSNNGNPANATYDMQFKLFDALNDGNQVGATITNSNVAVANGVFTVSLDFGAGAFDGSPRYLEISVRPAGDTNPYTVLSPRQSFSSIPYAMHSVNASAADGLSATCTGCVTNNQINTVDGAKVTGEIPTASVPEGSGNYIQNSVAAAKAGKTSIKQVAGFDIDGDGVLGSTLAIGTTTPTDGIKLDVAGGPARISPADNRVIQFGSPNTETGITIQHTVGANRADVRFDGSTLKLVTIAGGGVPGSTNGIAIDTSGKVGIGTLSMNIGKLNVMTTGGTAIYGEGELYSVWGRNFSPSGTGVLGEAPQGPSAIGVQGMSALGTGVLGSGGTFGVAGSSELGIGVLGIGDIGVVGKSFSGAAIVARSNFGVLVEGYPSTGSTVRTFHIDRNGTYVAGSDFAEALPTRGDKSDYEPGDLLVFSTKTSGRVEKSSRPYDSRVAGIYSTRPGVLGAEKDGATRVDPGEVPVAIVGIVPTKVSAENGAVRVGDLLTTSRTPGYAMRCDKRVKCIGAIVGKAIEPLMHRRGVIKVLVTLQ